MDLSSGRVKLNRIALKDASLVPRKRCKKFPNHHNQEEKHDVAVDISAGKPEEERVGTQQAKRGHGCQSLKGSDSKKFRNDSPQTRGIYHQSKPSTTSKPGSDRLKLTFTWFTCPASDSDRALPLSRERSSWVKMSEMSCQFEPSKGSVAACAAAKSSSGTRVKSIKCKPRQGNSRREPRVAHVARSGRDRGGEAQCQVKAGSADWDPQPAAANTGQVPTGTRSLPIGLPSADKNTKPGPAELGSEGCPRRPERAVSSGLSCCVCAPCKSLATSSKPEVLQSAVEFKTKQENSISPASQKIIVWINKYPKVTLCDVAQQCHAFSPDCGYIVPNFLKTKVVHCFKRNMRAGSWFRPCCLGHDDDNNKNPKGVLDKNGAFSLQPQKSLTKTRKHLKEHTQTCNGTYEDAAASSAPHIPGKCAKIGAHRASMGNRGVWERPEPGADLTDAWIYKNKRVRLASSTQTDFRDRFSHDSHNKLSSANKKESPSMIDGVDVFEAGSEDPESFTCQRVRVYSRKNDCCCARTYMTWPFSNTERTRTQQNEDFSSNQPLDSTFQKVLIGPFLGTSFQVSERNDENGENVLAARNEKGRNSMSSDNDLTPQLRAGREPAASPRSDSASFSSLSQNATDTTFASSLLVSGLQNDSSMSTMSPSALGLSDWETADTFSSMSSPLTHSGLSGLSAPPSSLLQDKGLESADASSSRSVRKASETPMTSRISSSPITPHSSDSFQSCESFFLLPQDVNEVEGEHPPRLRPYYSISPTDHSLLQDGLLVDHRTERFPPILSPISSPKAHSGASTSSPSSSRSDDEDEKEEINYSSDHEMATESVDFPQHGAVGLTAPIPLRIPQSCSSKEDDSDEDKSQNETDCEGHLDDSESEEAVSETEVKGLTERDSSSDEDDEGSSPAESVDSQLGQTEEEAASGILDEIVAFEQDILLIDVTQDDPELFTNLPQQDLLKLGPTRPTAASRIKPITMVKTLPKTPGTTLQVGQRLSPVNVDCLSDSSDITEDSKDRPWRPRCRSITKSAPGKQTHCMEPDSNNNSVKEDLERTQHIKTMNAPQNQLPSHTSLKSGQWSANMAECRRQKSNVYCRLYFSESLSCGYKICRFQHVPVEGDEKFCIEAVTRFIKNPMCLQKAGAVFTGYYHNNPTGVHFSMPVFLSLAWSLLKAGMMSEVLSVLNVSLTHKIVPGHEFVLALFNVVREKRLFNLVPELLQLTHKMASAGLVLSLDCLDCVKNTPEVQQTACVNSVSGNNKVSASTPFSEYLNLTHAIVEIELCTKQEDWRRMGEVFRSICQYSHRPNHVEQISGRIAIALLSEAKDKLALPFAVFSETVCQNGSEDDLVRSFVGRIGVSLMLRYHKTHQWTKGRRVVEILSLSKVNYSTLKGLFGNEDGASRCYLVTVATELFLLSGSVEGALNTLRENEWFLSSASWPCEPADLESRTRVLLRLAESSSHRDTLEVFSNLPGLKEPSDFIDISRYCPLFNSHLQVCLDRLVLPVASDTVDFMLTKNMDIDKPMLRLLFQKLGKQNLWLRAREVFRHSLSVGYYSGISAPPGFMSLMVPCQLGEVELALTFEMFITVNATVILHLSEATTCCLSIILKRTESGESEYLSAGSRLLSAACIPQPKLIIHYKAVNSLQEQVFTLDISSARCWLRNNHLWAHEVWTQ
ncbi:uncharacterized protein V6R79_015969 [Siganus canaliculatus]